LLLPQLIGFHMSVLSLITEVECELFFPVDATLNDIQCNWDQTLMSLKQRIIKELCMCIYTYICVCITYISIICFNLKHIYTHLLSCVLMYSQDFKTMF
jgi:hypothetical protein